MITDADVIKLAKVFFTKKDLDQINQKIDNLAVKMDDLKIRIDTFEDNVTRDIANLQDENQVSATYNQRLNVIEAKLDISV